MDCCGQPTEFGGVIKKSFSVEKLSAFYHDEWKNTQAVYVEVFDATGTFK